MSEIDWASYVRPPRLDTAGGVVLGIRLIKAAPGRTTARVKAAVVALREATAALQAAGQERQRLKRASLRPADRRFDAAWIALRMRLDGMARLSDTPDGQRAARLLETLLPQGTTFVTASIEAQWVQSATLLARIDEEKFAKEIDDLADAIFLSEVRKAHAALGEAIGVGEGDSETVSPTIIEDSLTELSRAIADYGRTLAGVVDEDDPQSVAGFRAAMAPLDLYRAQNRRTGTTATPPEPPESPDDEVTPESPVPEVEAAADV